MLDIDLLLKVTTIERFLQYYTYGYEILMRHKYPAVSAHLGRNVSENLCILDMKGGKLGLSTTVYNFIK